MTYRKNNNDIKEEESTNLALVIFGDRLLSLCYAYTAILQQQFPIIYLIIINYYY